MDLYSRKIIAWILKETLNVSCVVGTINKAKMKRKMDKPVIIHSDRGSQYVSNEYRKVEKTTQKKTFRGIMHAWNLSTLLSNMNG